MFNLNFKNFSKYHFSETTKHLYFFKKSENGVSSVVLCEAWVHFPACICQIKISVVVMLVLKTSVF